ncbi:MAG: ABC transporter permease subunit [Armatimonadetes bacterium]|nr:ABC transporter permease subunit [Armatimonadota bacterium]NCO91308.1 ABC transporter permease subunit [Armatimonadota bacterium]NCP29422.1 ABC transporter permease subunit [Armatimonadota bacterium]
MKRKRNLTTAVIHAVLLTGCVLFGFPFFWLLTTSMKEQREVFADPPQWIPKRPAVPLQSPYVSADEFPAPEPPPWSNKHDWRRAWPQIRNDLWTAVRPLLPVAAKAFSDRQLRDPMARGVWSRLLAGTPPDKLRDAIGNCDVLKEVLTPSLIAAVWERNLLSVQIRNATVEDAGFHLYTLPAARRLLWNVSGAAAQLRPQADSRLPTSQVNYDFRRARRATLTLASALPVAPDSFNRLNVPLRADRSFHRVDVEIDAGGRVYRSEKALLLDSNLWQEAAWQVKERGEQSTVFRDYTPLVFVRSSQTSANRLRVTLSLERNSFPRALYDKALRNYKAALDYLPIGRYLLNTVILVVLCVFGELLACSLVAYGFARLHWPGRDALFALLLATMMLPAQVTMIPVFLIFKHLGWYNTLQPLWVPSLFGSAFFIFMLRQFMRTIPNDLEDAAKIDGCGFLGCYWRIILPLMKPALAAVAIFTFMNTWNNFMGPLIYLNDQRLYPLSLGLFQFRLEHSTDFGMLMSASTIMTLPVVAVFFLAQKHFIQGITLTGMKG